MQTVTHYGIHRTDDYTAYLIQGRGSTNAIGIKKPCPFRVRNPHERRHCNHQINLSAPTVSDRIWDYAMESAKDPLFRAMLPIPKSDAGIYFLEERKTLHYALSALSNMSSPIDPVIFPMDWFDSASLIVRAMQDTNVQPLILTGAGLTDVWTIAEIAKASALMPRRVIITGDEDIQTLPQIKRISTAMDSQFGNQLEDLISYPWADVGAQIVRKFMRDELKI